MKATKDFQYANQVFEVQLENAEWLETKQDGDTLYIEDNTYVANDAKDPIEFLPGGESSSDGTTDTTVDLATARKNYIAAVNTLNEKSKALKAAEANQGTNAALEQAQKELDSAKNQLTILEAAIPDLKEAVTDAKAAYDAAKEAADGKNNVAVVKAQRNTQEYVENMKKVYTGTVSAGMPYTGKTLTATDKYIDDNGAVKSDATATWVGADEDTNPANTDTTAKGAFTAEGGSYKYYELVNTETSTLDAIKALVDPTSAGTWSGANSKAIKSGAADGSDATNVTLTEASLQKILEDEDGADLLVLTQDGNDAKTAYEDAVGAIAYLEGIETTELKAAAASAIAYLEAGGSSIDLEDLQGKVTEAEEDLKTAQGKVDAQKLVVAEKEKAVDAATNADVKTAKAEYEAAKEARLNAGFVVMNAHINLGKDTTDAAGEVIKLDAEATTADLYDADELDADAWVAAYNEDGKEAVAANVDIAVGSQTLHIKVTKKTNSTIIVETDGYKLQKDDEIRLPLFFVV